MEKMTEYLNKRVIRITQRYLKSLLYYDPEVGEFTWLVDRGPNKVCGLRAGHLHKMKYGHTDYRRIRIDSREYMEHQLAWLYMTGKFIEQVDHKDLNGLNNIWSNLREATASQNEANKGLRSTNTSGRKGVHWRDDLKKWHACISRIHLGYFDSKEEAAAAYAKKAEEMFGEFARV